MHLSSSSAAFFLPSAILFGALASATPSLPFNSRSNASPRPPSPIYADVSFDPHSPSLDFVLAPDLSTDKDVSIGDTLFDGVPLERRQTTTACLPSGTDYDINIRLWYGGAGHVVSLCPNAVFALNSTIFFTAANQEISTEGYPTGDSRAILRIINPEQSCAVYGMGDACQGIAMRNIQIDGARPALGFIWGGLGLVEFGGNTAGQIVDNVHIYEPRGWTCLHAIEGFANSCNGMILTNNQIGPCGNAPNNGYQVRKRGGGEELEKRQGQVFTALQWADGISLACKNSIVKGNVITDATDGSIVIFGAPGSIVSGNTITQKERVTMGGINLVDWGPFAGNFTGTVVENNLFFADGAMMKIGVAIGGMTWGSYNVTAARTRGGIVRNNVFQSGSTGYFGYAIAVAGHINANVSGNDASRAAFGGAPSWQCITFPMVPVSQAFVYDSWTTPGASLQAGFVDFPLVFLICQQPGLIISLPILGPILDPIVSILLPASETTTTVEAPPTTTTSFSSSSASVTPTTTALTTKSKGRGIATYPTTTSTTTTSTTSRTFTTTARSRGVKTYAKRYPPVLSELEKRQTAGGTRVKSAKSSRATPEVVLEKMVNPFFAVAVERKKKGLPRLRPGMVREGGA